MKKLNRNNNAINRKGEKYVYTEKPLVILFPPKDGQDLRSTYPELKEIDELKPLNSHQVKFIWYYLFVFSGIPTKFERIRESVREAFGDKLPVYEMDRYLEENWGSEVESGIEAMKKFNLPVRMAAKKISDQIYASWQQVAGTDIKFWLDNKDFDSAKKLIDMQKVILENLPDMIKRQEESYGVGEVIAKIREEGNTTMDTFYERITEAE